ncbi:uncharacterized protein LOC108904282 [Anoplophora glabripennis]|uniref:uncharacterized protein LOC108904282 n=1 Tax=Anoplophora glabripennis TaxID=217634 RepID=UPI0008736EF3|nr:uncharacterized protein LOC108904282 [Anoplophora glabripennis]
MASGTFGESEVSWMKDETSTQSTSLPEIIQEETNQITTVVIFVISAVLTITLLFGIAVFIDCRQEKLQKMQTKKRPRKILKLKLPIKIGRVTREDEATLADKMHCEPSPSNSMVV